MEQIIITMVVFVAGVVAFRIAGDTLLNLVRTKKKPGSKNETDYLNCYSPKWLFSVNERDAFIKIRHVTDSLNLILLAKVRLLDLIEPKNGIKNYKGALWKIQAKHVDFVICNEKLVPKIIIELDDSSHEVLARQERDAFVDEVLTKAGYRVIHLWGINELRLEQQIKDILKIDRQ